MQLIWLGIAVALAGAIFLLLRARRSGRQRRLPLPQLETAAELMPFSPPAVDAPEAVETPEPWLPRRYGEDYLTLWPRDPVCLFCYWEVTPALEQRHRQRLGREYDAGRLMLRLEGEAGQVVLETELPKDGSWYFHSARPGHTYRVVVGRRLAGGHFIELLRSSPASTPPAGPSGVIDASYLPAFRYYPSHGGSSSLELVREVRP